MVNQNTYIFRPWSNRLPIRGNDSLINDPQWDDGANQELNSYRSYNPMALIVEPVIHSNKEKDEDYLPFSSKDPSKHFEGRHSLFNAANAVGNELNYQVALNAPLLDHPVIRQEIRRRSDCSVKALVDASARGEMGRAVYTYADFMFCKHLGRISNNYLITLRRFPWPAGDHINYTMGSYTNEQDPNDHLPDIGRLVTWMGTPGNDMSSILKYDVNLPYKPMNAELQEANYNADTSGGFLGGLMNLASGSYRDGMLSGITGNTALSSIQKMAGPASGIFADITSAPPDNSWAYHRDAQKSYGPVDAITQTHYRQGAADGGIKFEHNITLTFDYELRSYNGINTRAAMLDLLGNILAVTFTNATYWGGAVRGTGAAQSNVFANLPIFHMKNPLSFATMQDAAFNSLGQIGQAFNNNQPFSMTNPSDWLNAIGNIMKGALTGLTAGLLNKLGRPQKNALNSMLNFQPTGLWHLMIGNPKHPIMSMGNMILDNCSIEHYGPLGLDDFPTGLKVTIALKHGIPRDNLKIEQMYMNGDFRIYQPLGNRIYDDWINATEVNSSNQGNTNNIANTAESWGGSSNQQTTEDAAIFKTSSSKRLLKYFGTDKQHNIIVAGKEAYLGADPRKKIDNSSGQTSNTNH